MARKLLKRWLPDHNTFRNHPHLQRFGTRLQDPNIWHLSRRSVPGAVAIGMFVAAVPLPFQMAIAAAFAILFRVNLPIAAVMTWVTNPITTPPMLYFAYRVGAWLLGHPVHRITFNEPSLHWLLEEIGSIWAPLLLGCLVCGAVGAVIGYFFVRSFWRFHVIRSWNARRVLRESRKNQG